MSCSDCFNGCADIVSDKCVRYTGIDIPGLGIENGDNLLVVENKITEKILTLMDGSGIIPIIDPNDVCAVVQELMPCCPPINLNQILTVFLKSICILNDKNEGLKDRIIILETAINALNADYDIGCLEGVTTSSDTHEIVQAIIDKLCAVALDLSTNYVLLSELDDLIATYLETIPATNLISSRMVPMVAVPYFGLLAGKFDITGAGIGEWERVFVCNGLNGAPDLRGVVIAGATNTAGGALDSKVNPANPGNPVYLVDNSIVGDNTVTLLIEQTPSHTHAATVTITDPGHIHTVRVSESDAGNQGDLFVTAASNDQEYTPYKSVGIAPTAALTLTGITATAVNTFAGGVAGIAQAHQNNQPAKAANYIMYIPL